MWDFFEPVIDTVSSVGGWMEDNPGATQAIGGAATATLNYMDAEKQRQHDLRREREERAYRDSRSMASSGEDNYGSHYQGLTKGLLAG
ncbi:MAG: hypothetical protein LPD71_00185 [Shewanella sp.]|nr:hypothetical protein [Shewanella sp.]MCF1457210.1 hypothetical protein [Shewanella sp.]